MNPKRFSSYLTQAIITAGVLLIGIFLLGKLFGSTIITINTDSMQRTFTVEGVGTVKKVPDVVNTIFYVSENGKTQDEARKNANDKVNRALEMLKSLGFAETDIKTTSFSVNEDFEFTPTGRTSKGFVANVSTSIKIKDIQKMNAAIDKLTALGINVSGAQYTIDDDTKYKEEARKKAVEDAKKKASDLAKVGGFKIGKIISINEYIPQQDQYRIQPAESKVGSPDTNIQPGSTEVASRVTITYLIKD